MQENRWELSQQTIEASRRKFKKIEIEICRSIFASKAGRYYGKNFNIFVQFKIKWSFLCWILWKKS